MAQRTFLLSYTYVPDMAEKRQPHRPAHLDYAKKAHAEGRLTFAAALTDPIDGAVIVLRGESESDVYVFISDDPYVKAGLVRSATVREIAVAIE
jgi:uncharacterized protein